MTLGIPTPVQVASGRQPAYKNVGHLGPSRRFKSKEIVLIYVQTLRVPF